MCVLIVSVMCSIVIVLIVCMSNLAPHDAGNEIGQKLWTRYQPSTPPQPADATIAGNDRVIAYAERVIDRQINKLRGVLSFDALILTFLSVERGRIPHPGLHWDISSTELSLLYVTILLLATSSYFCLGIFRVQWGTADNYSDFKREFDYVVKLVAERSAVIAKAATLAMFALALAIICFSMVEFFPPAKSPCAPSCRMEAAIRAFGT